MWLLRCRTAPSVRGSTLVEGVPTMNSWPTFWRRVMLARTVAAVAGVAGVTGVAGVAVPELASTGTTTPSVTGPATDSARRTSRDGTTSRRRTPRGYRLSFPHKEERQTWRFLRCG